MRDRIPTKPGRVRLAPSPDDDDLFILTRAGTGTFTSATRWVSGPSIWARSGNAATRHHRAFLPPATTG